MCVNYALSRLSSVVSMVETEFSINDKGIKQYFEIVSSYAANIIARTIAKTH